MARKKWNSTDDEIQRLIRRVTETRDPLAAQRLADILRRVEAGKVVTNLLMTFDEDVSRPPYPYILVVMHDEEIDDEPATPAVVERILRSRVRHYLSTPEGMAANENADWNWGDVQDSWMSERLRDEDGLEIIERVQADLEFRHDEQLTPRTSRAPAPHETLEDRRRRAADEALANYNFGEYVFVAEVDGWEHMTPGNEWWCTVYLEQEGQEGPSTAVTFTVDFNPGTDEVINATV